MKNFYWAVECKQKTSSRFIDWGKSYVYKNNSTTVYKFKNYRKNVMGVSISGN